MNLTQQLAAALSALLAEGLDHSTLEQGQRALDAYKSTARADAIVKRQCAERAALPAPYNLSAVEWIERACDTLNEHARIAEDTELLDVFDDLQHALHQLRGPRA